MSMKKEYMKKQKKQDKKKLKGDKTMNEAISIELTAWYIPCHNDLSKKACDGCMGCMAKDCNRSNCDRVNRCLCPGTSCICLGR